MNPQDRKSLGIAGLTPEECLARAEVRSEKDLQRQLLALLRLHGVEPFASRTDKRTTTRVGTPDILFAVTNDYFGELSSFPCAWEVKFGNGKLSIEQEQMHLRMSVKPNAWRIKVIRSVQEAVEELRELGIIPKSKGKYWLADTVALSVNRGPLTDILIQVEILSRASDPAPDCVETGFAWIAESVGEFSNGQAIQLTPEEDREALLLYAREYRRRSQPIEE